MSDDDSDDDLDDHMFLCNAKARIIIKSQIHDDLCVCVSDDLDDHMFLCNAKAQIIIMIIQSDLSFIVIPLFLIRLDRMIRSWLWYWS